MRSKLATAVRKEFTTRLQQELPQFVAVKHKQIPPSCTLFVWQAAPDLTCHLMLIPFRTRDWFTLEAGWKHAESAADPGDSPLQGAERFRLPDLWLGPTQDFWWKLVPELSPLEEFERSMSGAEEPIEAALTRVPAAVADALQHVVQYGLPYFRSISERHGYQV
jgi:hypothetical protein